jgi:hypothetical protein
MHVKEQQLHLARRDELLSLPDVAGRDDAFEARLRQEVLESRGHLRTTVHNRDRYRRERLGQNGFFLAAHLYSI